MFEAGEVRGRRSVGFGMSVWLESWPSFQWGDMKQVHVLMRIMGSSALQAAKEGRRSHVFWLL